MSIPELVEKLRKSERTIERAIQLRNRDLDPQLVWRGKDQQNRSDLVSPAQHLHIKETDNDI